MTPQKLSKPLTLREVLVHMHVEPSKTKVRWLRRMIHRRERLIQDKIMIQGRATGDRRGPYYTTLAVLQDRMPELFDKTDTSPIEEALVELREEMRELRERDTILQGRINRLQKRIETMNSGAIRSQLEPRLSDG